MASKWVTVTCPDECARLAKAGLLYWRWPNSSEWIQYSAEDAEWAGNSGSIWRHQIQRYSASALVEEEEDIMAADALLYWTVCPVPADDGEWYESHWHPCTCIHYNSEEDLQRMCDQKLLGVVVYD